MSKTNALAGLIGNYGDSDDETEEAVSSSSRSYGAVSSTTTTGSSATAAIHPAPIPHCPWSACYDETSGFTYYWNQVTNAVTWDAPPEYLLALKLAQQQLKRAGSAEVSAEEWQLYQQALAEKQNTQNKAKVQPSTVTNSKQQLVKKNENPSNDKVKDKKYAKARSKRPHSDDEDEKIELITSYYNSDSDSNEEPESPAKPAPPQPPQVRPPLPKQTVKKQKVKPTPLEYGPSLPPNQNYSVPIGPELPPNMVNEGALAGTQSGVEDTSSKKVEGDDLQDEKTLLTKLKDKAKVLEKLGGEIPSELRHIIKEENGSRTGSPKVDDDNNKDNKSKITNIDDLLDEIEKKELPKVKTKSRVEMFGDDESAKSSNNSARNSPKSGARTPVEEFKPLFPSSKAIIEEAKLALFPSASNIQEIETEPKVKEPVPEKKSSNLYLPDATEIVTTNRKKLRISNSVLPERKVNETPSYTTKYSQHIEGFGSERKGLGFNQDDEESDNASSKNTVNYGNGLTFTKGEVLNEDKKDDDLDDNLDLVDAKLKYLNELQPSAVPPVQEMFIQLQTLSAAFRSGHLSREYMWRWGAEALSALSAHEAAAAPHGWTCRFQRAARRYEYVCAADGRLQWHHPDADRTAPTHQHTAVTAVTAVTATAATAAGHCDMDISTTPPHPGIEDKTPLPPPLPPTVAPPPPRWADPPPPGCQDLPPLPPEPPQDDELQSFYKDIAALETAAPPPPAISTPATPNISQSMPGINQSMPGISQSTPGITAIASSAPHTASNSPERLANDGREDKHCKEKDGKTSKKKSKVKISSSVGLKHKSVSSLVAKWQQVAEEINSD